MLKDLNANAYRVDIRVKVVDGSLEPALRDRIHDFLDIATAANITILPILFVNGLNLEESNETIYEKSFLAAKAFVTEVAADFDTYDLHNESEAYSILKRGDTYTDAGGKAQVWKDTYGDPDGDETFHYESTRFEKTKAMLSGLAGGIKEADPTAKRIFSGRGNRGKSFLEGS
ncbi:MAG: hypothetical protein ACRCYY_17265 [Trueperaceae bacterium]